MHLRRKFGWLSGGVASSAVPIQVSCRYGCQSQWLCCNVGDNIPHEENIETYFNVNLKLLSCIGINLRLNENRDVVKRKVSEKIPALLVVGLQVYCAVSQVLLIKEAVQNHQYVSATQIGSDLFSNILISTKGCRLVIAITEVDSLLQELASLWRKYVPGHKVHNEILKKADNARLFCKLFVAVTFFGIPIYGLPSVVNLTSIFMHRNVANYTNDFNKRIFYMKYPFEIKNFMTYFFVILEEQYLLLGTAFFWMCADTLFAQLTSHVSLQFEMLRSDIKTSMNEQIGDFAFKRKFAILIDRHRHLLRICSRIENIYSPVILITMVLSALNICFNIFDVMEMMDSGQHKAAIVHGYLAINTILEIAFYCVFAEALTEQTRAIGDAIYESDWTEKDYKLRIYVYMLIKKSQNPFYCTAYGYFHIGHIRLTKILNAAMSYLMMLRATT